MKLNSIIFCILPAMAIVQGPSSNTLSDTVADSKGFEYDYLPSDAQPLWSGSSLESIFQDAESTCSLRYGLALVNETVANIGHLSDVANVTCSVPAATCARVSHKGRSSIFFCNFESQDINTRRGNLIQPAKQVSDACAIGYSYTHGYVARNIVDGSQSVPYLVVIGDDYAFAP